MPSVRIICLHVQQPGRNFIFTIELTNKSGNMCKLLENNDRYDCNVVRATKH